MVATRASTDSTARMLPIVGTTALPASWMPASASVAPSRVASHAPRGISQIGEAEAPTKTEVMIARVEVVRGR